MFVSQSRMFEIRPTIQVCFYFKLYLYISVRYGRCEHVRALLLPGAVAAVSQTVRLQFTICTKTGDAEGEGQARAAGGLFRLSTEGTEGKAEGDDGR